MTPQDHAHLDPLAGKRAGARRRRVMACLSAFAWLAVLSLGAPPRQAFAETKDDDRYWAIFRDGAVISDRNIDDWKKAESNPRLRGRRLFDGNHLRVLVDRSHHARLTGPHVVLANGDVLPGRVSAAAETDEQGILPPHLMVTMPAPLWSWDLRGEPTVAVTRRHVAKVVFADRTRGVLAPGTVVMRDGRQFTAQRLRWSSAGLRALTRDGLVSATFNELAEVAPPEAERVDRMAALLEDGMGPCPNRESLVGRIETADGAVLTYRRAMLMVDEKRYPGEGLYHIIKPTWSPHVIRVPFENIARRSYRKPDELPLSLLPAKAIAQTSLTGYIWQWRRNANVRRGPLHVAKRFAALGVGTHANSTIAFDLPPGAQSLEGWVGIDRVVGRGGCVQTAVYRDNTDGEALWQSKTLRGGDDAARFSNLNLKDAKRVLLVTRDAHKDRPSDADPLDIRDVTDWLCPMVRYDRKQAGSLLPSTADRIRATVPPLRGWELPEDFAKKVEPTFGWSGQGRWYFGLRPTRQGQLQRDTEFYRIKQKVRVSLANAWLTVSATRNNHEEEGQLVSVYVDGEKHESLINGDVHTNVSVGDFSKRIWSLGPFAGKEIELELVVKNYPSGARKHAGLVLGELSMQPIVLEMPDGETPLKPDVPLTSLTLKSKSIPHSGKVNKGQMSNGKPLVVRYYPFSEGFSLHGGSQVTYDLKPGYKRFVAVIGLADGSQDVGRFEVYLDGEKFWSSGEKKFNRTMQAQQIDVPIPPGKKEIKVYVGGQSHNQGSLANAGFMLK